MICTSPCSERLQYHIDHKIMICENLFRYGSKAWGELIREARALYKDGKIDYLDIEDFELLESDVGELGLFEGNEVLLDTPEYNWDREGWMFVFIRDGDKVVRLDIPVDPVTESEIVTI